MSAAVEIDRLSVVRGGQPVLLELSATVDAGTVTGLIGPSGSGKTTLMRCLMGLQRTAIGAVRVLGRPAGAQATRGRVGYVTQGVSVYLDLTVAENLAYFAAAVGASRAEEAAALDAVALGEFADRRVDRLSGGQQARVSLATALLGGPELLVLDEPTVGLDPLLRDELWTLFHRLAASGATLLVSSHVMDEARRCDRLMLLREGKLLADGSPTDLLARTGADDLDAAFLRLVRAQPEGS